MGYDITPILEGWDFDPEGLAVRLVQGDDGRSKLQMRIDMGLMQMELEGRPDGDRPHDFESLLDYFENVVEQHREKYGTDEEFHLDSDDCLQLMREGIQYYHRYLALLRLEEYERVVRDTDRNLRLFRFVVRYAASDEDKWRFDQWRPYVIMIRARAVVSLLLARKEHREAIRALDRSVADIDQFLKQYELDEEPEQCREREFLLSWREQVANDRPLGKAEKLEQALAEAVAGEQYERAAELRDELSRLRNAKPAAGSEQADSDDS